MLRRFDLKNCRSFPKLQERECLILSGHISLRAKFNATASRARHWFCFACRKIPWRKRLSQFVKKVLRNTVFFRSICTWRNLNEASMLPLDYSTSIVGAHWQRIPSLVSIGTILIEKLTKTDRTKSSAKRQFFGSFLCQLGQFSQRVWPSCCPPL